MTVLEPSVGEGVFVSALHAILSDENQKVHDISVDVIDIDEAALSKTDTLKLNGNFLLNAINGDYLVTPTPRTSYDIVIGNPPYISHHYLSQKQLQACREIHSCANLSHFRIRNIWPSFLIRSIQLVKSDGALAFVLPSEILQVKYARELQELIVANFERVEIFSFARLLFKGLEQDTVLVVAWKKSAKPGLFFSPVVDEQDLVEKTFSVDRHQNSEYKWSSHFLENSELDLVTNASTALISLKDVCTPAAGVVTAANGFFILNSEDVIKWGLEEYARPIIKSGSYISRLSLVSQRLAE